MPRFARAVAASILAALAPCALAQVCPQPGFTALDELDLTIIDLLAYDDGSGPSLFIGGIFSEVAGFEPGGILRWDGASFHRVGIGLGRIAAVRSMVAFDDGSGSALFVAGQAFRFPGDAEDDPFDGIARWDGAEWTRVGGGIPNGRLGNLTVHEQDGAAVLVAGGTFSSAGGVPVNNIAAWDGETWSPLGEGVGDLASGISPEPGVWSMVVTTLPGQSEAELVVGGSFRSAGGEPAGYLAAWDGHDWRSLGGFGDAVRTVEVFAQPDGAPDLYVGGFFDSVDGVFPRFALVRLGESGWELLSEHVPQEEWSVAELATVNFRGQNLLAIGGNFNELLDPEVAGLRNVGLWNGEDVVTLDQGVEPFDLPIILSDLRAVQAFEVFDDGSGEALYVGGYFISPLGASAPKLARWDGEEWSSLMSGGLDNGPALAIEFDTAVRDGEPAVYAAGDFNRASSMSAGAIARWNGDSWSPLGAGVQGGARRVNALRFFDDGMRRDLYVGGRFSAAGGQSSTANLARWDGAQWSSVGAANAEVHDLELWDDGSGQSLYAAGKFTQIGGASASLLARWDGAQWSPLPEQIDDAGGGNWLLCALPTADALYVGGRFVTEIDGVFTTSVARWDGASFSPLGPGLPGEVLALAMHDDGSGEELYAAGRFPLGGSGPNRVARWNGASWEGVGGGIGNQSADAVRALIEFDVGYGPELYALGSFQQAGDPPVAARNIARWDGASWNPVDKGASAAVYAAAIERGAVREEDALWIVGDFLSVDDVSSSRIARLSPCRCAGDATRDGLVDFSDLMAIVSKYGAQTDDPADLDRDGVITFADLNEVLVAFGSACD